MTIGIGLLLGLLGGGFKAGKNIATKLAASQSNEYVTGWGVRFFGMLSLGAILLLFGSMNTPSNKLFWVALAVNTVLYSIATYLVTTAFKVSDISIVAPIYSLSPIAIMIPSAILLNEIPSPTAGLGIILIGFGAYTLNIKERANGLLEPFKKLGETEGAKYIFLALIFISIVPSVDKIGITHSSPLEWIFYVHITVSIALFALMATKTNDWSEQIKINYKLLALLGLINALLWATQAFAYTFTQVSYVQALKHVSLLLSVAAGKFIFNEQEQIRERFTGSVIILIGVALVLLTA